jgi:hypothetical protein
MAATGGFDRELLLATSAFYITNPIDPTNPNWISLLTCWPLLRFKLVVGGWCYVGKSHSSCPLTDLPETRTEALFCNCSTLLHVIVKVCYSSGYNEACRNADDISREELSSVKGVHLAKLPYERDDENSVDIPLSHCINGKAKYSRRQRGADALLISPYPEIITQMYEKHPDARSAPYYLLLPFLSDGNAQTAEDLYKDQLGKWPNARYEPH